MLVTLKYQCGHAEKANFDSHQTARDWQYMASAGACRKCEVTDIERQREGERPNLDGCYLSGMIPNTTRGRKVATRPGCL